MKTVVLWGVLLGLALAGCGGGEGGGVAADGGGTIEDGGAPSDGGAGGGSGIEDGGAPSDGGAMTGSGTSAAAMIGAAGGMVQLGTASLSFPPGAVGTPTMVRITESVEPTPTGYRAFSPVYRFEPEGLTFAQPVRVVLPYRGDVRTATVFWTSVRDAARYERVGGTPGAATIEATITHFSAGFVADGVDYAESGNRATAAARVLDTRLGASVGIPASVALFFTVEDDAGRPVPGLGSADFVTVEDGSPVSSEGRPVVLPAPGLQVFVTLSIDLSSSTRPVLSSVIAAARAFVDDLERRSIPAQVGVEVFAGDAAPTTWQRHTLDLALVRTRLDALGNYTPADPSSTNLYGAIVSGVRNLEQAEAVFETRNAGGAFARGYLVVFTDGADTAGRNTLEQAVTAARTGSPPPAGSPARGARNEVIPVGLRGADFSAAARSALVAINARGFIEVSSAELLAREFRYLATRIAGQTQSTYVLGYCSPRRTGTHTVGVQVMGAQPSPAGPGEVREGSFSAAGFGPGCTVEAFAPERRCSNAQCGGLGCGACDDRTSLCNANTRQCVNNCTLPSHTTDCSFTNNLGYTQRCEDRPTATQCAGTCANLQTSASHCGQCGRAVSGGTCVDATPSCATGTPTMCGTEFACLSVSTRHCGQCGRAAPAGGSCSNGVPTCPTGSPTMCGTEFVCLSLSTSHCGQCGRAVPLGGTCVNGTPTCPSESPTTCGTSPGRCVNLRTSAVDCGQCGRAAPLGGTCVDGTPACSAGSPTTCGGTLACLSTSTSHCGQCGRAVPLGGGCLDGTPRCPTGSPTMCGTEQACLSASASHCGQCGRGVPPGGDCVNGSPVTPASIAGGTYTRNDRVETVEALYLDVTEVTASAYAACVGTGACTAATAGAGTRDPRVLPWAHALEPTYCNAGVPGLEQHPINCVDWAQAVAYCSWRGKRLPTTAEWVWAARGREEARTFPWGTDETAEKACWRLPNPPPNGTCAVGSLPAGASRDGVLDLAGNVGEWTASGAYPTYIDSWWGGFELLEDLESVASGGDGSRRSASIGFRCAKTQ